MHIYYTHVYDIKQDTLYNTLYKHIPFHIFLLIHQSLINLSFVLICCVL